MKVLRKDDMLNNIGYCAYYLGTDATKVSKEDGTLVVDEGYLELTKSVVLLFNTEDRFIDRDGNVNEHCTVNKVKGNKIYWLGGIQVYKTKDDNSSIDIIEAVGISNAYYVCNEEKLNKLLSGKEILNHHELFADISDNLCFPGDDNDSLHRDLMVMTNGNVLTSSVFIALDSYRKFFCRSKIYQDGEAAVCYWSNKGDYICLPVKLTNKEGYLFDLNRKVESNLISDKDIIELIDLKRLEGELSIDELAGIIYTALIGIEDVLTDCREDVVKDLVAYFKHYIDNTPVGADARPSAVSFKDRAAKLLGL